MKDLLAAIVADDPRTVKRLLKAERGLASALIEEAQLYQSRILHWIYVGDTALHLASAGYRVEIVRLLLAAGADPNAASNHRRSSPVHYAADGAINSPEWDAERQVSTLRCLVDAGGNISAPDKNGATPLHRAVRTRCAAAVRFLLEAGADPTRKNKPGSTPFHLAVQTTGRGGSGSDLAKSAQREIIQIFLSLGVSKALEDGKGQTVLDCARSDWVREALAE